MAYSPITLFVYNRESHTRQTIEALKKNALASQSDLIVFSDAAKSDLQIEAVSNVRQYIHQINGFKSVSIIERETNLGLAESIIDGVTSVVHKYGRVIVLEDDLITSPYFLNYMNEALNIYRENDKVMHISGYMFPVNSETLPETFFLRTASCWGWATWQRAWSFFDKNPAKLLNEFTPSMIDRFNMDGTHDFWRQVEQNQQQKINTWAIFWYASIFLRSGLCLHPAITLVNNIGHDNTGEHCGETQDFESALSTKEVIFFERNITESLLALKETQNFFLSIRTSISQKVFAKLQRIISPFNPLR